MTEKPVISIITPVYNEQESLPRFFGRVIPVMESVGLPFEIIAVSDGSKDGSEDMLREYCAKDPRVKAVFFSRNFGQQAALLCGFKNASGDAAICIDADLQDPPEIFPQMIAKWKEGYDIVHGKRNVRKGETFLKKITSTLFMKVLKDFSGLDVPANTGEFKLYDRKVIDAIVNLPERSRYLRAQATWVGFRTAEVRFDRDERLAGETKYTMKKMLRLAETGIVPYSPKLLHIPGKIGKLGIFASLACFAAFIVLACIGKALPVAAWLFPAIVFCSSVVLALSGITNVYLGYMYEELKQRPVYIEREKLNFEDKNGIDR